MNGLRKLDKLDEALHRESILGGRKVSKNIEPLGECHPEHIRVVLEAEAKQRRQERIQRRKEENEAEMGREAVADLLRQLSAC